MFLGIFNYLEMCVTDNGWTDTKIKQRKLFFIFTSSYFFLNFLKNKFENWCHTTRAAGHILKEMRKTIFYHF